MNTLKIDPQVDAVIKPIIYEMTKIDIAQQSNPVIGTDNEPKVYKEKKKECVHITYDGNDFRLRTEMTPEGKLVCRVCGREIGTKFDRSSVDAITECLKVVNQIVVFGLVNGLRAEPLLTLLSLKRTLPAVAQLMAELNEYVKREEANTDAEKNIGYGYTINNNRNITSY